MGRFPAFFIHALQHVNVAGLVFGPRADVERVLDRRPIYVVQLSERGNCAASNIALRQITCKARSAV
jgi:hypothetical protein